MADLTESAIVRRLALDQMCRHALQHIDSLAARLARDIDRDETWDGAFAKTWRIVEALPLGTNEFTLAESCLRNARRYLRSGERGAACYELRLLSRSLLRSLAP